MSSYLSAPIISSLRTSDPTPKAMTRKDVSARIASGKSPVDSVYQYAVSLAHRFKNRLSYKVKRDSVTGEPIYRVRGRELARSMGHFFNGIEGVIANGELHYLHPNPHNGADLSFDLYRYVCDQTSFEDSDGELSRRIANLAPVERSIILNPLSPRAQGISKATW